MNVMVDAKELMEVSRSGSVGEYICDKGEWFDDPSFVMVTKIAKETLPDHVSLVNVEPSANDWRIGLRVAGNVFYLTIGLIQVRMLRLYHDFDAEGAVRHLIIAGLDVVGE